MVLSVHSLMRDGEKGIWRWGKRVIIYLLLHCHHQNDSCIKMGSDYASERALFISAQLSTDAVSALRMVWELSRL